MGVSFLVSAFTGLVIFLAFESGAPMVGKFITFLGYPKLPWINVHSWSSIIMIVAVLVHLVLHFRWIVTMTKNVFLRGKS